MPFMLGALLFSALVAIFAGHLYPKGYVFPAPLRLLFIGVIGVAIGARLDATLLGLGFLVSLGAVSLFVVLAQGVNYLLFRRMGGLDAPTAWFFASPGGMTEMGLVAISPEASPAMVALHHLYRITITVMFLSMARRLGVIPRV